MSSRHGTVRDARRKCIPCNAPLVETTDGGYVCVDCGERRMESRQPQRVTVEHAGVTVTKTTRRDAGTVRIAYTVESTRSAPVTATVTDESAPSGAEPGDSAGDFTVTTRVPPGDHCVVRRHHSEGAIEAPAAPEEAIDVRVHPATGDTTDSEPTTGNPDATGERRDGGRTPPDDYSPTHGPRRVVDAPRAHRPAHASRIRAALDESAPRVLAALPAYNEAETIARVVDAVREYADAVLVVDDGSEDATAERAASAGAVVLEHPSNRGYGAALQTIFAEANRLDVDHLVVLDGDGQHDPSDIPRLTDAQRATGAEIVIGNRFEAHQQPALPWYRRIGLWVVNGFCNLSMGVVRAESRIGDTQSGFRAYSPTAVRSLAADDYISNRMGASTDILHHAHQHDYDIAEVGTTIDYDVADANNHNPLRHGFHLLRNMLRTVERERPMLALGLPGLLLTVGGLGIANAVVHHSLASGELPLGWVLPAVLLTVVGIFASFTAIILHSMNTYHPR